jgi:GNAT superfamily N-acetyltransferase
VNPRGAAAALALGLVACQGTVIDPGAAGAGSGGSVSVPGAGGSGSDDPARPPGPPPARCEQSVVGPRALVRLTAGELGNSLRDIFPAAAKSFSLGLSDPLDSKDGFVNPSKLRFGEDSSDKLLAAAKTIADTMLAAPAPLTAQFPCVTAAPDAACAGAIIKQYGRRLFRRPLTDDERQRYLQLHATVAGKADFAQGMKWALVALMQSPHALYRRQIGQPMGGGLYQLTPFELASELAYTFTGTTPSEALLGKAEAGLLGTRAALVDEARALLQSPAGRAAAGEFFRLWLGYDLVTANQRDQIAGFAALRPDLAEETRRFIDKIVFEDRGGLPQLLTAPFTMLNPSLAQYYGMAAPAGAGFAVAPRANGQGIGLLAQGSVLAERSQSLNSSPTKRGILVRQKLLCLAIPAQPAVVPDLPPTGAGWKTTRQRFENVHAQGACAGCHRLLDPLGFPLEHFDEGGRFRATENGEPIDASGTVVGSAGETLIAIKDGEEELATALAARADVAACAGETLVKFLFAQDRDCLAGDARNDFVDGKIGFLELAAQVAGAPQFSQRRD